MTNTLLLSLSLKVNQWRSSCSGNTESFIKETQHVVFGLNDGNQEHHVLPKTTEQKRQHVEICLSSSTDEKSPRVDRLQMSDINNRNNEAPEDVEPLSAAASEHEAADGEQPASQ